MKSLWSDKDAKAAVAHYRKQGVNEDLALRTYTTRLLGGDPRRFSNGAQHWVKTGRCRRRR